VPYLKTSFVPTVARISWSGCGIASQYRTPYLVRVRVRVVPTVARISWSGIASQYRTPYLNASTPITSSRFAAAVDERVSVP